MAQLKFSGIQPVEFNGRDCTPKLDTGKRLRLARLKFDEASIDETDRVLASCFPDDEEYVAEFLRSKMTPADKHILQAYLLNGEKEREALALTSFAFDMEKIRPVSIYMDLAHLVNHDALRLPMSVLAAYMFQHSNMSRSQNALYVQLKRYRKMSE